MSNCSREQEEQVHSSWTLSQMNYIFVEGCSQNGVSLSLDVPGPGRGGGSPPAQRTAHHICRITSFQRLQTHSEEISPASWKHLKFTLFLPVAALCAQYLEAIVSSNWTDVRLVQGSCFCQQLRELTLEHVQSTDEELVGILHTDTHRTKHRSRCKCTN